MSNPYSNEFMEMIIRMLTIDPANRITVEELIQLTSLQPGERDVLNSEPNLVSGDDAIRPHPMHAMPSRIVADKEIPGQAVNRSDSREIPQFAGYQGAPQAINQGTYVAPLEQNRNAFFQPSAPSQIFNAISTNQIQFKPSGVDNGDHGLNSRHQQSQNEQKGDERAIQRSVSRGNFFDPSILNRVNIARDQSRQPLTGRDVSPIPTAHGASSQRVHNLEGSAISSSRVKRKDLSKSPLKKVYGSRLAEDDRSNSRTPHTQSMQNISLNDNTSMNPVKHSILQSGLNNGVYHNQSERIVGFKPNSKVETPGLQGFNSSSQTNLHQSSQITNPLQMRYPLSSNQAYNSKFYNQSQPGLIVSQQPVISNQRVAQPAQKRDLTPVRIDSQDRPMTSYSQKGVVTVRENKIPPIPTQTGRVTRYSVDKNGQRHLISDSQPQIPRSQVIQGSMPNIVTNGLGWNSKNGNQTYENTSHLGGVYNRPTPGYASQHYQNSTGVIRSALGHQIQSYGGEIQTNSQGTGIQTANEVALPRNNSVSRIITAPPQAQLPPKPTIQSNTLIRNPSQISLSSNHHIHNLPNVSSYSQLPPFRQSNNHHGQSQASIVDISSYQKDSQNHSQSGNSSQITPLISGREQKNVVYEPNNSHRNDQDIAQASQEVNPNQRLIEKLYVKDEAGNTVELKTFLCPDGSTKTERRIAINSKGELHGKFKETGVDLSDVIQADKDEVSKLIQENAIKIATENAHKAYVSPTKPNILSQNPQKYSSEKKSPGSNYEDQAHFSSFHQRMDEQAHQEVPTQQKSVNENTYPSQIAVKQSSLLRDRHEKPSPLSNKQMNEQLKSLVVSSEHSDKNNSILNSANKSDKSPQKAKVTVPPSLANSIKGKTVKVRYKEHRGKTYPVGISGPELTKEEKEWLLRRIIEKEGLTIEEIEAIEGGHLIDVDNGSEYRLTADNDRHQRDSTDSSSHIYKNERGSNLVKDIQNQIINEQDEEVVSQSSGYPSQRIVSTMVGKESQIEKFDLMHRPAENSNQKDDEIWFRTKEQMVLDENDQYRNIDMSKSSRKRPQKVSGLEKQAISINNVGPEDLDDYNSEPRSTNTKFNYGTNQHYNPGFPANYDTGNGHQNNTSQRENDNGDNYDPSDIDALLKHNENLLSKIKIDMRNIGESFVSHTDMGSSRVGLKNNLSGVYRPVDFDSKEMMNRSPIGIQEFESFKTKTAEKSYAHCKQDKDDNRALYDNHRMRVDEIWEKTMNSSAKRMQTGV